MGREVEANAQFRGMSGLARVLLESDALILRGAVRARVLRAELTGWRVDGDDLCLQTPEGPMMLTMGRIEAAKWIKALDKPLPDLAQKLGLAGGLIWVLTAIDDAVLEAALAAGAMATGAAATLGLAVVRNADDLQLVLAIHRSHPDLPIWVANIKGPKATVGESAVRTALRAAGMIDTKACAISQTLSGTRYQKRHG
jgi:hypothetical protein